VTVVVAMLPSHGSSARPGRQSQTVPAASVRGTVVTDEADDADATTGSALATSEKMAQTITATNGRRFGRTVRA
jgi:hypothetical protein